LFSEKCLQGFLPQLFSRWDAIDCNHVVTIVLFARVFYSHDPNHDGSDWTAPSLSPSPAGGWHTVLLPLKKEFLDFQKHVLETQIVDGSTILFGQNSAASEGNVLETVNLALNLFDRHYVDRDLSRTGLSILIVTPGIGFFEVDPDICAITTQRVIVNGIGLDLVCLSKPPLFTVPLFQ
ncbi:hypothetical protein CAUPRSCDRAFT_3101, partial [Caulochytrium protostelioides]